MAKSLKHSLYDVVFRPLTIPVALLWTHSFVNVPRECGSRPWTQRCRPCLTSSERSVAVAVLDLGSVLLLAQTKIALVSFFSFKRLHRTVVIYCACDLLTPQLLPPHQPLSSQTSVLSLGTLTVFTEVQGFILILVKTAPLGSAHFLPLTRPPYLLRKLFPP